ncbi:MAG TPA: hypothetical protein DCZ94_16390 [Lentisphaeria bacterium]|nr:MAG: hypothetical protein A2X48_01945 [Lentisphaerae bacterium GWF2_49_21]HBC88527.1 hypothetical protein [Lentisphaeria bacterium]
MNLFKSLLLSNFLLFILAPVSSGDEKDYNFDFSGNFKFEATIDSSKIKGMLKIDNTEKKGFDIKVVASSDIERSYSITSGDNKFNLLTKAEQDKLDFTVNLIFDALVPVSGSISGETEMTPMNGGYIPPVKFITSTENDLLHIKVESKTMMSKSLLKKDITFIKSDNTYILNKVLIEMDNSNSKYMKFLKISIKMEKEINK